MTDDSELRRQAPWDAGASTRVGPGSDRVDEDPRDDPDARADQLESEIDRTREDLTETVQAISQKLDPSNIAREATDSVKQAAFGKVDLMTYGMQETWREVRSGNADGIIETVKSNPVPAGMVALGLGMLFLNRGQRAQQAGRGYWAPAYGREYDRYPYRGERGSPEGLGSTVSSAADQVGERAGQVGEAVGRVAESAGERVSGLASTASDAASAVPRQAGEMLDQGSGQVARFMDESPLVAGLAAVAAGAVLGLMLPSTQVERRALGPVRDDLVEKAERTANELVDKADQSMSEAQRDAQGQMGSSGQARSQTPGGTASPAGTAWQGAAPGSSGTSSRSSRATAGGTSTTPGTSGGARTTASRGTGSPGGTGSQGGTGSLGE